MAWSDFLWWCVCSWVSQFSIKGFLFPNNRPFFPPKNMPCCFTIVNSLDAARSSWHGPELEGLLEWSSSHSQWGMILTEALLTWKHCGLSAPCCLSYCLCLVCFSSQARTTRWWLLLFFLLHCSEISSSFKLIFIVSCKSCLVCVSFLNKGMGQLTHYFKNPQ